MQHFVHLIFPYLLHSRCGLTSALSSNLFYAKHLNAVSQPKKCGCSLLYSCCCEIGYDTYTLRRDMHL